MNRWSPYRPRQPTLRGAARTAHQLGRRRELPHHGWREYLPRGRRCARAKRGRGLAPAQRGCVLQPRGRVIRLGLGVLATLGKGQSDRGEYCYLKPCMTDIYLHIDARMYDGGEYCNLTLPQLAARQFWNNCQDDPGNTLIQQPCLLSRSPSRSLHNSDRPCAAG